MQTLWDAVWTHRSTPGIAVATWTRELLPSIHSWPRQLRAGSGPGCKLQHALEYISITLPWGVSTPSSTHGHI